jgi:hypothetical protein
MSQNVRVSGIYRHLKTPVTICIAKIVGGQNAAKRKPDDPARCGFAPRKRG